MKKKNCWEKSEKSNIYDVFLRDKEKKSFLINS